MFAGHVGAALAIGRSERRVNVGVLIAAALFLDVLLWTFVLLGWESVAIPADFTSTHQAEFVFPYSHGLVAAAIWSTVAGGAAFAWYSRHGAVRWRIAFLIAAAVFSHWILDALVHRPELPLAGNASARVGLGLWDSLPVALGAEAVIVVVGLCLFLPGSSLPRSRAIGLVALLLFLFAFTVMGMTIAPPPPSAFAMAGSSLLAVTAVCALAWWLGRVPGESQP